MDIFTLLYPTLKLKPPIKLFEAFSGIGTQAMALQRITNDYEIVGFSEIDKYAIQSYTAIHGNVKNYGDITKMKTIPQCDIFTWSFPCTDLSKAGQRKGMTKETRSGLVYDVLRLVKDTQEKPQVLIMENVPDLVQTKFSRQFNEIQLELEAYGYTNYVERLNSKNYGVAQNRDRVFMVSLLGEYNYDFPKPIKLEKRLKDYLEVDVDKKYYLSTKMRNYVTKGNEKWVGNNNKSIINKDPASALTTREGNTRADTSNYVVSQLPLNTDIKKLPSLHSLENIKENYSLEKINENYSVLHGGKFDKLHDIGRRVYNETSISPSIHTMPGGNLEPKVVIPENTKKGYTTAQDGDGVYTNRPHQKRGVVQKGMIQTIKANNDDIGVVVNPLKGKTEYGWHFEQQVYDKKGITRAIKSSEGSGNKPKTIEGLRIRKLTPLECWRLMGIDDSDFYKAQAVCSNSQLYKQAGNAIVVDVFETILKELIDTT